MRGGGSVGGAVRGGFGGGGFRGGGVGGFRGGGFNGFRGGGFRGGFNRGRFGYGFSNFGFYPGFYGYGAYLYDPFWSDFWDTGAYPYSYPSYPYPYQNPYSYGGGYGASGPSVMIISNNPYGSPQPPPAQPEIVEAPPNTAQAPARATQPAKYEEPLFLVAFRDGTIRAVLAYWLDGANMHYVTMEHEQRQTPLSTVDRDLSERLNRERNVTFRLPAGSLQ